MVLHNVFCFVLSLLLRLQAIDKDELDSPDIEWNLKLISVILGVNRKLTQTSVIVGLQRIYSC